LLNTPSMNKYFAAALTACGVVAGFMAPESLRTDVHQQLARITGDKLLAAANPAASAATASPSSTKPPQAVPLADVQRPLALPAGAKLSLSLGLFASEEGAQSRRQRVTTLGYTTQLIPVSDANAKIWYLLAAGSYDSDNQAETARSILAEQLGGTVPIEIVQIPPPKPPSG